MAEINEINDSYGNLASSPSVDLPVATATDTVVSYVDDVPEVSNIKNVQVYADGIEAVSFDDDSSISAFDVRLTVMVTNNNEEYKDTKTFKITKRIAFDKVKLAAQASEGVPITVVEGKVEYKAKNTKEAVTRFRQLAGLE